MVLLRYADSEASFCCRSRRIQSNSPDVAPPVRGPKRPAVCLSSDGYLMGGVLCEMGKEDECE